MHRPAARLASSVTALLALAASAGDHSPDSSLVIGTPNQLLSDGAAALEAGRFDDGIRLTLAGLELPNNASDTAAAYSNLCAGYAGLKRWQEALPHCDRALGFAITWRALNNRAAVYVGLERYELALADVTAALELEPDSATLQKSLQVIIERREAAAALDRRKKPAKA